MTATRTTWTTPKHGRARWMGVRAIPADDRASAWTSMSGRAAVALRAVAATIALLGLATTSRAEPAPLAATWREGTLEGEPRALAGDDLALSVAVEWPGRDPQGLRGCVVGDMLTLAGEVSEGRGLSGVLRGEAARPKVVRLSLVGRVTRGGEEGDSIAVRLIEDGRTVRSERWLRPGPARLEIVSVTPGGTFAPKSGPLTVTLRVKNAPIAARFRAEVSGDTAWRFYEPLVPAARRLEGRRIALVERDLGTLEPGEHTLEWDGRDDTAARRLALGGACTLIVEDRAAPDELRDERAIEIARPPARFLGPRWPKTVDASGNVVDPGRIRRGQHDAALTGFQRLGFAPASAYQEAVTPSDVFEALSTSATVVVATHGGVGSLSLYASPQDERLVPEHVLRLVEDGVERKNGKVEPRAPGVPADGLREFDLDARAKGEGRPFRDVRLVIVWACLAGSGVERDHANRPKRTQAGFVGLPARLRACGVDIVVAFANEISASGHQPFMERLLDDKLKTLSIGDASRRAADHADALTWGNPVEDAKMRARGAAPLREALVIFPPDTQTDRERLDPACWGISTN